MKNKKSKKKLYAVIIPGVFSRLVWARNKYEAERKTGVSESIAKIKLVKR